MSDEPVEDSQAQATEERASLPETGHEAGAAPVSDDHPKFLANINAPHPPETIISLPPEREAPIVPSLPGQRNIEEQNYKQVLSVVAMQIILFIFMMAVTVAYGWFHNVPNAFTVMLGDGGIEDYSEAIARYNFVGVSPENPQPSFFSVMIEAGIWSLAGVLARGESII